MPRITCPTCASVLEIDADMVGQMVQCGSCQAEFLAKPDKGSAPADDDRPSKRKKTDDDDDDDDRPSRRKKADDDDDDDRPSRRRSRRDDDDDDDDDAPRRRRRRRSGSGSQDGGNGLAVASLVLGILSLVLAVCCGLFSLPISIIGAILGVVALNKSQSKGMAITGISLSAVSVIIAIIMVILGLAMNVGNNNNGFGPQPNNNFPQQKPPFRNNR